MSDRCEVRQVTSRMSWCSTHGQYLPEGQRECVAGTPAAPDRPGDRDQGYTVELGGQVFTQAQWEALQPYIEGRASACSEDAATWSPTPVSPGDRDQQQAAEIVEEWFAVTPYSLRLGVGLRRALSKLVGAAIAVARDEGRAEEAAHRAALVAKIEALIDPRSVTVLVSDLRAVLDGS